VYVGSSSKVIMAHLPKQALLDYYQRYADAFAEVGFVQNETAFLEQMRKIKKQGYYYSSGELDPQVAGLSVPVKFSLKEPPLALTLLASKNRFDFVNLDKLVQILQEKAQIIENKFFHDTASTSDIRNNLTK
uniref:IclR family transcriptional regulator domain-containing protein n=1 Tax=Acinetobacter variabilis TaxID=70346 RepID=UPI0028A19114